MKRNSKFFFLISFILLGSITVNAQRNMMFQAGEKLTFVGSYYMSSLWTDLVQVTMKVNKVDNSKTDLLHLQGVARTYSQWDSYFKIRDSYQSWVSAETVKPIIFKRNMDEGGYTKDLKYVFKRRSGYAVSTEVKKNGNKVTNNVKITPKTFDMVSLVYYLRTLPYERIGKNRKIPVTVIIDNKLEIVYAKFKGIENIKVGKYGTKKCYKIGVSIKNQKIVKNKETNNVWITADNNRVPVLIKAVIPVGSIQIRLSEMSGLRH